MATDPSRVPLIWPSSSMLLTQPDNAIARAAMTRKEVLRAFPMRLSLYRSRSAQGRSIREGEDGAGGRHPHVRIAVGQQVGRARRLADADQSAHRREADL